MEVPQGLSNPNGVADGRHGVEGTLCACAAFYACLPTYLANTIEAMASLNEIGDLILDMPMTSLDDVASLCYGEMLVMMAGITSLIGTCPALYKPLNCDLTKPPESYHKMLFWPDSLAWKVAMQ